MLRIDEITNFNFMEAIFLALIQQLNGAVFVLIALLIIAFYTFFKVGSIVTYFKETKDKNEKIDGKIDNIKDSLSTIKATTELLYQAHLKTSRKAIYDYLKECGFELTPPQHNGLKKLLQQAIPDQISAVYDESEYLIKES